MTFLKHWRSLEAKFLTVLLAALILVAVLFSVAYTVYVYRNMERQADAHVARVADVLVEHVAQHLLNNDGHTLRHALQLSVLNEDIRSVSVFDASGRRLAHIGEVSPPNDQPWYDHTHIIKATRPILSQSSGERPKVIGSLNVQYDHSQSVTATAKRIVPDIIGGFLLLVTASISVALLNRRMVLAPLQALLSTLERIQGGDAFRKVPWEGNDDIARVIQAFNALQDSRKADQAALDHNRSMLRESEDRLTAMSRSIPLPLIIEWTDDHGLYLANEAAQKAFPCLLRGHAGKFRLADMIAEPDVRERYEKLLQNHAVVSDFEALFRLDDGRRFWGLISATPIELQNRDAILAVVQDISTLKEAELALQSAKEASDQANESKDMFLRNAGHEIRTPLNAILGLSHLLQGTNLSAEQWEHAHNIHASGMLLLGLVEDVLDFSGIENAQVALRNTPFMLGDMVSDLSVVYSTIAESKHLDFTVHEEGELPVAVMGDSIRLSRALNNLLENAVAFTQEGSVSLIIKGEMASEKTARLTFTVRDTGIGMAPHAVSELFQPFSQADTSQSRPHQGIGMGLSTANRLIEKMGSHIHVETAPGEGASFYFTIELPLADPAAIAQAAPSKTASGRPLDGKRILLVEDNPINRLVAEKILRRAGAAVEPAENGLAAIAAMNIDGDRFDAILMDLQMPEMDGHEATRMLRKAFAASVLPIIALTANAMSQERSRCLEEGMNDYLTKPIDPDRLIAVLARHIKGPAAPLSEAEEISSTPDEDTPAAGPSGSEHVASDDTEEWPGLNLEDAMSRMGGDMDLYKELLGMFNDIYDGGLDMITTPLENGDMEEARRAAHSLKGVAGNISAFSLHKASAQLEKALKTAQPGDDVSALLGGVEQEMAPVLDSVKKFIAT